MKAESLDHLNEEMLRRFMTINPDAATGMGLHDPYDFELPHGGFKRLEDTSNLLHEWAKEARAISRNEKLTTEMRICLKALELSDEFLRFSIDDYPLWKMYPDEVEGIGGILFIMLSRDYAPLEFRAKAMASRLQKLPQHLAEFRTRFDDSRAVRLWTDMAIESCEQLPGFLTFIERTTKDQLSRSTLGELKKGLDGARCAISVQLEWLKELRKDAVEDFAMGKRRFAKLMKLRGLGMTPSEILALGEKYLLELKKERERIAQRIAPGKTVDEVAEMIKADAPKTFEEGLKATEKEMRSAKAFIAKKGIATVDEDAVLKIIETPAFLAPVLPYAALFMSSKFDKVQEGAYVVTRPKNPKDLGSHLNYASIINTAVHEAYPGHFHQGVRSNARHWMLQLPNMVISTDTMYIAAETVEGWAHYCEKMMFDHGYKATEAAEFEMVTNAIWRAYRIIADVKLAQGDASVEEMIQMGMREANMPRAAAESEVKRYTRTPGQALSYLIGKHLILEFRKEMEKKMGKKFDERRFHDLVADYGYLPISLMKEAVREEMKV